MVGHAPMRRVDALGNKIGQLTRSPNRNELVYRFVKEGKEIDIQCSIRLLDDSYKLKGLPIEKGENLLFGDFNIPKTITDKISGLGQIVLDDGLAYFRRSRNYGNVDGTLNIWQKSESYAEYGGQSINLEQFWKAKNAGMSTEKAAFETFSGKWAEKNGFTKVRVTDPDNTIKRESVTLNFLK